MAAVTQKNRKIKCCLLQTQFDNINLIIIFSRSYCCTHYGIILPSIWRCAPWLNDSSYSKTEQVNRKYQQDHNFTSFDCIHTPSLFSQTSRCLESGNFTYLYYIVLCWSRLHFVYIDATEKIVRQWQSIVEWMNASIYITPIRQSPQRR